jgi:hypothetical protein
MKKRVELESDKWKHNHDSVEFSLGDDRVATIRAIDSGLEVSVAGYEAPMRVRKITLLEDLDWLFLDFEEASELHRLGLRLQRIPYNALNSDLRSLLADRLTLYSRRHRS